LLFNNKDENFAPNLSMVGHSAPTEVCKFNPVIRRKTSGDNDEVVSVCAVASQDEGVSIWQSSNNRPLAVVKDIFSNNILDITWHPNGLEFLACSYDGTVARFAFKSTEFTGKPLNALNFDQLIKEYKEETNQVVKILETPEQYKLEKHQDQVPPVPSIQELVDKTLEEVKITQKPSRMESLSMRLSENKHKLPQDNVNVLKISKTKDGKKRVTPIFVKGLDESSAHSPEVSIELPKPPMIRTLSTPKVKSHISKRIGDRVIEARNTYDCISFSCYEKTRQLWQDILPFKIVDIIGNEFFFAVTTLDKRLYTYSITGRR
jgi:protein HIRA/HIR1